MNSIDEQQEETNHADLSSTAAVERIREIVDLAKSCFFCTNAEGGLSNGKRPMSVQKVDDAGNLWFLSAADSHKNAEIERDPTIELYFQGSAHSDFMHLRGRAEITTARDIIDDLWEPIAKVWFTDGKDDPRITAIKVSPTNGYYWDTRHNAAVAGIKMLIGLASGKTLDDSISGNLHV